MSGGFILLLDSTHSHVSFAEFGGMNLGLFALSCVNLDSGFGSGELDHDDANVGFECVINSLTSVGRLLFSF